MLERKCRDEPRACQASRAGACVRKGYEPDTQVPNLTLCVLDTSHSTRSRFEIISSPTSPSHLAHTQPTARQSPGIPPGTVCSSPSCVGLHVRGPILLPRPPRKSGRGQEVWHPLILVLRREWCRWWPAELAPAIRAWQQRKSRQAWTGPRPPTRRRVPPPTGRRLSFPPCSTPSIPPELLVRLSSPSHIPPSAPFRSPYSLSLSPPRPPISPRASALSPFPLPSSFPRNIVLQHQSRDVGRHSRQFTPRSTRQNATIVRLTRLLLGIRASSPEVPNPTLSGSERLRFLVSRFFALTDLSDPCPRAHRHPHRSLKSANRSSRYVTVAQHFPRVRAADSSLSRVAALRCSYCREKTGASVRGNRPESCRHGLRRPKWPTQINISCRTKEYTSSRTLSSRTQCP